MNVTQLRKRASELEIPGRSKMNTDQLREAISEIENNSIQEDVKVVEPTDHPQEPVFENDTSCHHHAHTVDGPGKSGYTVNTKLRARNRMGRESRRKNRKKK